MSEFNFEPADFVPFKDKEVLKKVDRYTEKILKNIPMTR